MSTRDREEGNVNSARAHALQRQQVLTDLLAQISACYVAQVLAEGLKRTGCNWRVEN